MYNTDVPSRNELPSAAKLVRSTIIAAIVALVLLVTVVMPAEYALDPTGTGRLLGLTEMGEIKEQLAEEAAADEAAQMAPVQSSGEEPASKPAEPVSEAIVTAEAEAEEPAPTPAAEPEWDDEVRVVLTPGEGTEFKLTMEEGATARFSWVSEGGPINYDTHGDGSGQSISYEKGRGVPEDEGELEAAFTGNHGWFFRNRNDKDITLVLRTGGDYGQLKKLL
ncbi:hypothetical protein FDP08_19015 [Marinobacter panjinensis]|uniref:Transmembrane anchor protein n=1 Tax=Marinobacter panjinensis TaxID=2576384 RepID=A0A4U6QTY1_9GAMM|nr:hypothetical protein [Marinobacter panjinensis]MCR8915271.1 hypothetical protein [Marinobacter panjinensis]TKV64487.1 hypothetical protein FDP08_19015 [Marinobacter panjinensis]